MFAALIAYLTHPAFWIALLVIGGIHETGKKLVLGPKEKWPKDGFRGWKGVYRVTCKSHSLVLGALLGLIPGMPVTESLATEGLAGSMMFYMGAGACAMIGYASVVGVFKDVLANYGKKLADKG
jgi:hypothetical protein